MEDKGNSASLIGDLLKQGNFHEAIGILNDLAEAANQTNEIRLSAFLHLGLVHYFLSHFEESITYFRNALSIDGNSAYAHSSVGYIFAACPDAKFQNAEEAIYHARRGCELKGWKDPSTLSVLAIANMCAGYYETARPLVLSAIRTTNSRAAKERLWHVLALIDERIPYVADPLADHRKMVEDLHERTRQ